MIEKIYILYKLIFLNFQFTVAEDKLKVILPDSLEEEIMNFAKDFIKNNRDFIFQIAKKNHNSSRILSVILDNKSIPLSFAQERVWFIERYEGGTHAYNIPLVFKLKDLV
ncbi:MAG: hypothetical protein EBY20_01755, partial [Alphaproteobacteria bacterium]|nr:hypothetical protein [Alphaproteobacteria bacterium]